MNVTSSPNHSNVCKPSSYKWEYVFLMPLPILSGLINVLVWLVATFYRRKLLRQSYVYFCVTSTLLSNALFLSIHLWDEVAGFQMPDMVAMMKSNSSTIGVDKEVLWTLCTSATVSLLAVACGNLTVLIYVLLESAYFRKTVRQRLNSSPGKSRSTATKLESKRRRAAFLVGFVWLLPALLTIAAVVHWHCADECTCPPGADGELCPHEMGCSRIWPPMTNSFITVNIALWFVEVIVLCYVTISGIQKFQNYNFQNMRSTTSQDDSVVFQKSIASSGWLPSCSSVITTAPTEESGCQTSSVKVTDTEDDVFKSCTSSHSTRRRQLMMNPRLRLVCYLTITFVICTIMIPIAFFVDLIETKLPHIGFRFASMVLVQIYTLLCPILLVRYLSSLQTALANVASSMSWCWRRAYGAKTQVKSRNKTKLEN